MEKILLPTEQAELAKATTKVVEAERVLSEARYMDVKWALLPALAISLAVYMLLGDLGASWAVRFLLGLVSAFAVSAVIELPSIRRRLYAAESLVQELRIRLTIRAEEPGTKAVSP